MVSATDATSTWDEYKTLKSKTLDNAYEKYRQFIEEELIKNNASYQDILRFMASILVNHNRVGMMSVDVLVDDAVELGYCESGIKEWLKHFGARKGDIILLKDVLKYNMDFLFVPRISNRMKFGAVFVYFYAACDWLYPSYSKYALEPEAVWLRRESKAVTAFLDVLATEPYSQKRYGKMFKIKDGE